MDEKFAEAYPLFPLKFYLGLSLICPLNLSTTFMKILFEPIELEIAICSGEITCSVPCFVQNLVQKTLGPSLKFLKNWPSVSLISYPLKNILDVLHEKSHFNRFFVFYFMKKRLF